MFPENQILHVKIHSDEPSYESFKEAVDSVAKTQRYDKAKRDTAILKEKKIIGFRCGVDWLEIILESSISLLFTLDGGIVQWEVRSLEESDISCSQGQSPLPILLLKYDHLIEPIAWDREKILRDLVGKSLVMVSASHAWAYLCVEKTPEIVLLRSSIDGTNIMSFDYA
jgi:hypothetical protein